MRRTASAVTIVVATALALPALGAAQEPVKSFDRLNTRLKAGDTIWVTDAEGREIKGKVQGLSPASLQVKSAGATQEFPPARVATIKVQPKDRLRNGVLWGAGAGFVLGAVSCGANPDCAGDEGAVSMTVGLAVMGAAAGAGIGALVDSLKKGPKLVVYRAPGAAGAAAARLSVAPLITPRAKGVAVSFAF